MTLLVIIQDAANEVGVDAPDTVIGNTDPNVVRLLALSNRGGKALARRYPWQELTKEFTHTTLAAESQGLVESIMPGFNWDVYHTIWNRTLQQSVDGPLFPREWQHLKAMGISGPYPQFRIREKTLRCIPTPTAGQTFAGEYVSRYWCQSSGGTGRDRWAADDDTGVLNEDLLTLDLIWRWKASQGLAYAEEKQEAEIQINQAMAVNGSNRILNLEGDTDEFPFGVVAPPGNWSL